MRIILLSVLLLTITSSSLSQDISIDRAELRIFMDGVMTEQLIAYDIPGAAVSIVKETDPGILREIS